MDSDNTPLIPHSPGGVILIDKPRGPSSHQVAAWVREMTGVPNVGHTGTLDPQVSGVLVVLLGKAVRLTTIMHQDEKEYIALLRIQGDVSETALADVIERFTGKTYQRPPRRSAVKRALRIREILELEMLSRNGRDVLLRVRCDSGTYIRSLCHHMGLALGVGGQMVELRRTRSGPFFEKDCHKLHDLRDATEAYRKGDKTAFESMVLSPFDAVKDMPLIKIKETAAGALCHGARLSARGIVENEPFQMDEYVVVTTTTGDLICVGEALMSASRFSPGDKALVISPRVVFPENDAYPAIWKGKNQVDLKH